MAAGSYFPGSAAGQLSVLSCPAGSTGCGARCVHRLSVTSGTAVNTCCGCAFMQAANVYTRRAGSWFASPAWRPMPLMRPGLTGMDAAGGDAGVSSVSCAAAGGCAAGGSYVDGSGNSQAFAASKP